MLLLRGSRGHVVCSVLVQKGFINGPLPCEAGSGWWPRVCREPGSVTTRRELFCDNEPSCYGHSAKADTTLSWRLTQTVPHGVGSGPDDGGGRLLCLQ